MPRYGDAVTNEELLTALEARFERIDTELRHVYVQVEGLWGETRRLAESIVLVDEKLERFRAETHASFDEQRAFNEMLVTRIEAM